MGDQEQPPEATTMILPPPRRRDLSHRLRVRVVRGPDAGAQLELATGEYTVGKSRKNNLVLRDRAVSRKHLTISVDDEFVHLRDLNSRNGSHYAGASFEQVTVGPGCTVLVGNSELRFEEFDANTADLSSNTFGGMVGHSVAMRAVFRQLEKLADTDLPILITGETGTGKELVARGLHKHSRRANEPLIICDLAGISPQLIESELFGHVRGSFTGAHTDRTGAFEDGNGGTVFLDELGELEISIQPRLLRVLESHQIKRVGASRYTDVDVRVVAATNRDLKQEIADGKFREDLYHRVGGAVVELPPLRERADDIPLLAKHFLAMANKNKGGGPTAFIPAEVMAAFCAQQWPGNARQLKNVIDRAVSLVAPDGAITLDVVGFETQSASDTDAVPYVDPDLPFKQAKDNLIDRWERDYLLALFKRSEGNVSAAARNAGIDRAHLYRLLRKHKLNRSD